MEKLSTDVAVIGAGTAGLNAVAELRKAGSDWLLIEDGEYGTTCARDGCMPSKLLIAAADAAHTVRTAAVFGIDAGGIEVIGEQVFARVRQLRDEFVAGVVADTLKLEEKRRLKGRARFRNSSTLVLDSGIEIEARAFVVAVGSSSRPLPVLEDVVQFVLSSETVFEIDDIPRELAVIGSGPIGLELGQAFARLGSTVSIISNGLSLAGLTDPQVAAAAQNALGRELTFHLDCDLQESRKRGEQAELCWLDDGGREHRQAFHRVLLAAGRPPNLDGLGLADAGVELDDAGRPECDAHTLQCGDLPIFIAGDANAHRPLLHEATDEGRIAGRNAAHFPQVKSCTRRVPLSIVFTSPQIAMIGCRHQDIDRPFEAGGVDFENQGRARVLARNQGLGRIYAEPEQARILGAELCAPQAEHLAHLLAWAMQRDMTVPDLLSMPFYHPVVEEGLKTALRALVRKLDLKKEIPCEHRGTPTAG